MKGRFIFEQTQPDVVNFSYVQFEELTKEAISDLNEFLSHLENLSRKEFLEIEVRIREKEAALAKANALLKVETEKRKREEEVLRELGERIEHFSSEFLGRQERKLKMTIQGLRDSIEAMMLAIAFGVKNVHNLLKEERASHPISFEQNIFNIQSNYGEIRRILENLGPSISDELGILAIVRIHCQEFQKIYNGIQKEKEFAPLLWKLRREMGEIAASNPPQV